MDTLGLRSTHSPYSSVQRRRFNRKMREQVGSGMADIGFAISSLEEKEGDSVEPARRPSDNRSRISKGKGKPLTREQRRRAL